MKRLVIIASLVASVALAQPVPPPAHSTTDTTNAPVISGPAKDAVVFMTTAGVTNWLAATYAIYSVSSKDWGGGVGVGYKLGDFVVPTLRLDYLAKEIWMPSGNIQLQLPVTIMNKITLIPMTFAAVGTTVSGGGNDNGSPVGILGIGMAARLSSHWDLIADWEIWNGGRFHQDNQIRGGIVFKF